MKKLLIGVLLVGSLTAAHPAFAQSRPLVTEDPETVPAGHILLEAGVDYGQDVAYPVSGLRGNLWRIGTFGLSFGVSSIAEIQIDGGLRNRLDYLFLSHSLVPAFQGGAIFRKGLWGTRKTRPDAWETYPEIANGDQQASDHAAIYVDLAL